MKISEVIKQLEALKEEHGDLSLFFQEADGFTSSIDEFHVSEYCKKWVGITEDNKSGWKYVKGILI